jgi:predicted glutamine amidotransferase
MINPIQPRHECDLFLLSSHRPYFADRLLPSFAHAGGRNIHGWGIGYYVDGEANVVRSCETALRGGHLNRAFSAAVQTASSPVIVGHLRFSSAGSIRTENNHPFKLNFLGYDWLLAHNRTANRPEQLVNFDEQLLLESDSDTPRVFEFIRAQIINYYLADPKRSLMAACKKAYAKLRESDSGKFNIILSNGYLSFVFIHWRPFFLLQREKDRGAIIAVSTLRELTTHEEWVQFDPPGNRKSKLLVFNGPTLVWNGVV